jgi:hypothetical protein
MREISNYVTDEVTELVGQVTTHHELLGYETLGWVHLDTASDAAVWRLTKFGQALHGSTRLTRSDQFDEGEELPPGGWRILTLFAVHFDPDMDEGIRAAVDEMKETGHVCRISNSTGVEATAVSANGFFCGRTHSELPKSQKNILAVLREKGLMQKRFESDVGDWVWRPTEVGVESGLESRTVAAISILARLGLGNLVQVELDRQIKQIKSDGYLW